MKHYLCRMSILGSSCITFPCLELVSYCIHLANCTPLIPSDSGNLTSPKLLHQLTPPVNYSNTLKKIVTSDKTWCSGCLEDNNDLFNLIRLFARGQTNSIMDKIRNNGCVHSGLFCRIWNNKLLLISRCLYNGINLFNMDRSVVNSPNTSLVVKNGTK